MVQINYRKRLLMASVIFMVSTAAVSLAPFHKPSGAGAKGERKPEMILVEGGEYEMGCLAEKERYCGHDETPIHNVKLLGFYIGKYEVTFQQYDEFCDSTKHALPKDNGNGRGNLPVVNVSWYDAIDYCNWRSLQDGLKPCYSIDKSKQYDINPRKAYKSLWVVTCDFSANGYRLPTEAEWEYAARGGKLSQNYIYSGGNDLKAVGWFRGNCPSGLQSVGQKAPNELGIFDMSGNASEWCWDFYYGEFYEHSPEENPTGPEVSAGEEHPVVLRGGSWSSDAKTCRSTNRYYNVSRERSYKYDGFRLVRNQ